MKKNYNENIFTSGTVSYTDFDISFRPSPLNDDLVLKNNIDSIKQSIKTLLLTNQYERPFQPELYGGINSLLFDQMDEVVSGVLEDQIRTVIENYEPRVEIIAISVSHNNQNEVIIKIKFNIQNKVEPVDINILITRTR